MSSFLTHSHGLALEGNTKKFSHVEILIEPHEVELESETSTDRESCDYTPLRRRAGHRWTLKEREALCILRRWYCNSWKELAKVFNGYFAAKSQSDHIIAVSGPALAMQLFEMQSHGVKRKAFESVFIETLFVDEHCAWTDIRRGLEQAARAVAITLERRVEDREELLKRCDEVSKNTKRKKTMNCTESVLGSFAYKSDDEDMGPATPAKRPRYLTPSPSPRSGSKALTGISPGQYDSGVVRKPQYKHTPATPQSLCRPSRPGPSPLKTVSSKRVCMGSRPVPLEDAQQLPKTEIAFRFYDSNSSGVNGPTGIRAGLFSTSTGKISLPPNVESLSFRKEALKHLSWTREPTPFISMYESLLPVLHRGLQSPAGARASVAIINLHTISNNQTHNNPRLYLAAKIIKQLGITHQVYGYRGISEWLVWGMIEKEAIVTTFRIEDIRRFLTGSPDVCIVLRFPEVESSRNANEYREKLKGNPNHVGRASGRVVGKFLAFVELPDPYIESAAKKMARDWQLNGNKSRPRRERYLEGVQLGLQGTRAELKASRQAKAEERLANYLKQVDSGLQRRAADDVPFERTRAKPQMLRYLQRVDSGLGWKRVDLRSSGHETSKRHLASYLQRVELGEAHAKGTSRTEHGAADLGPESDIFLSRRRRIEAVCSGR